MTARCLQIVRQPIQYIRPHPADPAAMKSVLPRKPAKHNHAQHDPSRSPCQACDVVGAQELLPGREALVHPLGQRDAIRRRGRGGAHVGGKIFRAHKRPSTCGSGRLGLSCHVWGNDGRFGQALSGKFRGKFSETAHRSARLRSTWRRRPTGSAWSTSAMAMNSGTFTWRW